SFAETGAASETAGKLEVRAAEESKTACAGAAGAGVAVAAAGLADLAAGVAASKVRIDCGVDACAAGDWE
ncbi:MAG: hypothetical protein WB868_07015, partial [Xanthobacteraceae bacterium]